MIGCSEYHLMGMRMVMINNQSEAVDGGDLKSRGLGLWVVSNCRADSGEHNGVFKPKIP